MPTLKAVIKNLKNAEKELERQLSGIRTAISSLAFGSAASPSVRGLKTTVRKKRKMSAAGREAIAAAQRKRWAKIRKAKAGQ